MTWLILPGWGLPPSDYQKMAKLLGPDTRVLDSWKVALTANTDDIRAELGAADSPSVDLMGHSLGGLAAIEWALRYPAQVRRLVLLDPTAPDDAPSRSWMKGRIRRVADGLAGATVVALWPAAERLRRWTIRRSTGAPDDLPRDEAHARYGTRESCRFLAGQLSESWEHAARVARMLDGGAAPCRESAPLLLVGAGKGGQCGFLRSQWDLGRKLHARTIMLAGQDHLFPLSRPDLVFRHVEKTEPNAETPLLNS